MVNQFDVIVIGQGPAGLFAALELITRSNLSVLLLEQVKRIHDTRNVSNGWMGGSAKSNVKLFVDPGFGGYIEDIDLIEYFLAYLQAHSEYDFRVKVGNMPDALKQPILNAGISIDEPAVITVPSDKLIGLELSMRALLTSEAKIKINAPVEHISKNRRGFEVVTPGCTYKSRKCILAMGRGGPFWLERISKDFELGKSDSSYDLGVRLECPHHLIRKYTDKSPNFRLRWDYFRTSAISAKGAVEMGDVFGLKTSNGRCIAGKSTIYSNFSLLKTFTGEGAFESMLNAVQIVNILSDGQLLREPANRIITGNSILTPLKEFDEIIPGIQKVFEIFPKLEKRCSLYAPEARLNSLRYNLTKHGESDVRGMYLAGDMSGRTKSFVQSACSGLLAAKHIIQTIG